MIATGEALTRLLPQRPPMLLIDALLECANDRTVSQFQVPADLVLVEDGYLSEAGLIENIAQTAAAGAGYGYQQGGAGAPPIGFIAAIKDLRVGALPAVGTVLTTEVLVQNQVLEFTIVRGTVRAAGATFAECEMRIFIKDSE
ncbi:3-hydroxyacyl-ACP dehydratase [Hymenobacter sp. DH14]|uniref:3-hydroxyacyl-ACP dehydratase n=1 Tax=Hymenobacter cyanobacteriorum TaxID=2926463 RepID=A0A9X1VE07_9BACT|nr:3-hydroxyacyl-ACP dehydratase [Hymenobacter cyanobacteriorum]MCI1186378.1 3-hydroxyacyl-ACP dehydratase [Hymenobacter cyanobacteriorum]